MFDVVPFDDAAATVGDALQRLLATGAGGVGDGGAGMGASGNGCLEFFDGPVSPAIDGAAVLCVAVQDRGSWVEQGGITGEHET